MQAHHDYYRGKTILVTGGAGAIGSNLTAALSQLDAKLVIILDDMSSAVEWNIPNEKNVMFIRGSVVDEQHLKRVFNLTPDVVFHLAALFANQKSVDYPEEDLQVNGLGLLRTLEYAAISKRVQRFVYASSGCAIAACDAPLPLTETSISLEHSTPYQITKMLGEMYCNYYFHQYGLPVVKPRFFNSFGPGEVPGQYRNVIPNFIYWALQGKDLVITGNPLATRDFAWVFDLVDALLKSGYYESVIGQAFNLSSGKEIEIGYLAKKIIELTGSSSKIVVGSARKWDVKSRLLADCSKAEELIGYCPDIEFETGLKLTIEWFRQNWDNIVEAARFNPGVSSANPGTVK
ncbi:MAG TPA: NAD-dependent epimerase/dehydratase family protein [Negativicutes bacterium]|nr:NAD-dependent epimerase/dehydratase family protein [Negativicutes bacterium]